MPGLVWAVQPQQQGLSCQGEKNVCCTVLLMSQCCECETLSMFVCLCFTTCQVTKKNWEWLQGKILCIDVHETIQSHIDHHWKCQEIHLLLFCCLTPLFTSFSFFSFFCPHQVLLQLHNDGESKNISQIWMEDGHCVCSASPTAILSFIQYIIMGGGESSAYLAYLS